MFLVIINGPNLNLIGKREPEIYGTEGFDRIFSEIKTLCASQNILLKTFQSNHEGVIIDYLQEFGYDEECCGIIINPGALAHYSYAVADAIAAIPTPVIEVHISNIHARELFRHTSVTAASANGMICGLGLSGYKAAATTLLDNLNGNNC